MTSIPIQRVGSHADSRASSRASAAAPRVVTPGEHADAVHGTLNALVQDVNKTTEIIRRHQQQQMLDKKTFQSEMEVSGRIEVEPQANWLQMRLKSVSTEDMKKELTKVKEDQRQHAVVDTLAALVYDVNATAEVLRRAGEKSRRKPKMHEEVEYRLRLTPAPDDDAVYHHDEEPKIPDDEEPYIVESVKKDYGVDLSESQTSSLKRRARSATPRRTLNIEKSPAPANLPICAYCSEPIEGPVLTALAPNANRAQKFHPHHFMCCYCQKALNLRGTFREHELRPYCHECFYKLWNGLRYEPDNNQRKIEKLI